MKTNSSIKIFIILIIFLSCNNNPKRKVNIEYQQTKIAIPEKVRIYSEKKLLGWRFILLDELIVDWKDFVPKSIENPTYINADVTGEDNLDFVCLMFDSENTPHIVMFENYSVNIECIILEYYVAEYKNGIGLGLYLFDIDNPASGFIVNKFESSMMKVYWKNGRLIDVFLQD